MKKNGFTLVELLAVFVILAIIALITIAAVGDIIENARKKSFESSANGIWRQIELDYTEKGLTSTQSYTITDDEITNTTANPNYTIIYNGKVTDATGTATASYDTTADTIKIEMQLENNNYCAKNNNHNGKNQFDIVKGSC